MHQMSNHVSEMLTAPVASPVGPGLESPGGLESSRDAAIADVNCECSSRMRRRCRSARVSFRGSTRAARASSNKYQPADTFSEPVSQSSARDVRTGPGHCGQGRFHAQLPALVPRTGLLGPAPAWSNEGV